MSEMMLSLLTLSPLSLLSFSFAPCGFFKCENDSGVNQTDICYSLSVNSD